MSGNAGVRARGRGRKRRRMSAEARATIAAAQRACWVKQKEQQKGRDSAIGRNLSPGNATAAPFGGLGGKSRFWERSGGA